MSQFIPIPEDVRTRPRFAATPAEALLSTFKKRDGDTIITQARTVAGDNGGNEYIYRRTGKSLVTPDNGFYIGGVGDDYLEAKDKTVVNALQWGCVADYGTGNTDNTAAMNAAAAAAGVSAFDAEFVIPTGNYLVLDTVTVPVMQRSIRAESARIYYQGPKGRSVFVFQQLHNVAYYFPVIIGSYGKYSPQEFENSIGYELKFASNSTVFLNGVYGMAIGLGCRPEPGLFLSYNRFIGGAFDTHIGIDIYSIGLGYTNENKWETNNFTLSSSTFNTAPSSTNKYDMGSAIGVRFTNDRQPGSYLAGNKNIFVSPCFQLGTGGWYWSSGLTDIALYSRFRTSLAEEWVVTDLGSSGGTLGTDEPLYVRWYESEAGLQVDDLRLTPSKEIWKVTDLGTSGGTCGTDTGRLVTTSPYTDNNNMTWEFVEAYVKNTTTYTDNNDVTFTYVQPFIKSPFKHENGCGPYCVLENARMEFFDGPIAYLEHTLNSAISRNNYHSHYFVGGVRTRPYIEHASYSNLATIDINVQATIENQPVSSSITVGLRDRAIVGTGDQVSIAGMHFQGTTAAKYKADPWFRLLKNGIATVNIPVFYVDLAGDVEHVSLSTAGISGELGRINFAPYDENMERIVATGFYDTRDIISGAGSGSPTLGTWSTGTDTAPSCNIYFPRNSRARFLEVGIRCPTPTGNYSSLQCSVYNVTNAEARCRSAFGPVANYGNRQSYGTPSVGIFERIGEIIENLDKSANQPYAWEVLTAGVLSLEWAEAVSVGANEFRVYGANCYYAAATGTTGATPPTHSTGTVSDDTVNWTYYGPLAVLREIHNTQPNFVSADNGDQDVTLTVGTSVRNQVFSTDLTATRRLTIAGSPVNGDGFRITRLDNGDNSLIINNFLSIAKKSYVELSYDTSAQKWQPVAWNGSYVAALPANTAPGSYLTDLNADPNLEYWLNGDANLDTTADADDVQGAFNATWQGTGAGYTTPLNASGDEFAFDIDSQRWLTISSPLATVFTFACWIKLAGAPPLTAHSQILDCYTGDSSRGYAIYLDVLGKLWVIQSTPLAYFSSATAAFNNFEVWQHLAVVAGTASSKIFKNGVQSGSTFESIITAPVGITTRIGNAAIASPLAPFRGAISGPRFYSRALTDDEVNGLFNGEF